MLTAYLSYLRSSTASTLHDLAYSLQTQRSTLAYRVAFAASTPADACSQIEAILSGEKDSTVSSRQITKTSPKILPIFTDQGAQWALMGAELVKKSPFAAQRLSQLDDALAGALAGQASPWTLYELIVAPIASSKVDQAAISQPCVTSMCELLVRHTDFVFTFSLCTQPCKYS